MKRKFIKKKGMPYEERNKFISMVSCNIKHLPDLKRTDVINNIKKLIDKKKKEESLAIISNVTRKISEDEEFTEDFINDPSKAINEFKLISEEEEDFTIKEHFGDHLKNVLKENNYDYVVKTLDNLKHSGYKEHQINMIIYNLERNDRFRRKFIKNPSEAISKIGIQIWS